MSSVVGKLTNFLIICRKRSCLVVPRSFANWSNRSSSSFVSLIEIGCWGLTFCRDTVYPASIVKIINQSVRHCLCSTSPSLNLQSSSTSLPNLVHRRTNYRTQTIPTLVNAIPNTVYFFDVVIMRSFAAFTLAV